MLINISITIYVKPFKKKLENTLNLMGEVALLYIFGVTTTIYFMDK
jgi:hypothetical protein